MELLQEKILKILLILIWSLVLIHMTAEYFYLYWLFKWFDIFTHFLGGVWLGLASIWIWYLSGYFGNMRMPDKKSIFIALGAGLLIGFVWEFYEFIIWQLSGKGLPINYIGDSSLDIIVDVVGAVLGFFILKYIASDMKVKNILE